MKAFLRSHEIIETETGIRHKSRVPIFSLARLLINKHDVHPDTYLEVYAPTGTQTLSGKLSELAKWTVKENDSQGIRRAKYEKFPDLG